MWETISAVIAAVPPWTWTVIVAIVTSIASTIVVEYAAKPRLEARKARLLQNRQQLDEVVFGLQTLSLHISSLPRPLTGTPTELFEVYKLQLEMVEKASAEARATLGRLSHRYVQKHSQHLRRTAYFLAYVETTAKATRSGTSGADARLRDAGGLIEHFDTYFLIYLGLEDSAEPLIKRLFWRIAERTGYEKESEKVALALGAPPTRSE